MPLPEHDIHTSGDWRNNAGMEISCKDCRGKGVWLEEGDKRFFWSPSLGMASSAAESVNSIKRSLLKFAAFLFILFAYLEAINFILTEPVGISALYEEKGFIPFIFWLATGMALYFIQIKRIRSESEGLAGITRRQSFYGQEKINKAEYFNIDRFFSAASKEKVRQAVALAEDKKNQLRVWHLLKVFFGDPEIAFIFNRLEKNSKDLKISVDEKISEVAAAPFRDGAISPEIKRLAILAFDYACKLKKKEISNMDLLLCMALGSKEVGFFLEEAGVKAEDLPSAVWWAERKKIGGIMGNIFGRNGKKRVAVKHRIMNRAWTARATPALDRFSHDITDLASAGAIAPIVDREREMNEIIRILERNSKNNVLLIGDAGSGRKSIVRELGRLMIHDNVLSKLKDKRLVALDASLVISGAKAGGELEERIHELMNEIMLAGNIILFIPDIHNLAESGSEHGFDVSEILAPIFTSSSLQVIGTTTFYDYHKSIEKRSDFADSFDVVKIDEVAPEVALEILIREVPAIEDKEDVAFTFSALRKSVELSRRYIFNKLLPAKAIDVLSEAAVMVRSARGKGAMVGSGDIMRLITEKTGVPAMDVTKLEAEKLVNLEDEIHKRMVDQAEAVKTVSEAIKRMRVGLKNEKKPAGVFLFLGPTGVGKTELAKTLAEVYFGSEQSMVRLDMSEFQESRSIDRLIGSADGQISGLLTEGVKRNPFSLVLLDEFEKSNSNVLDLFLQIFDDGRVTEGMGRVVDFTNTIIIATSNAGSKIIQERLKEGKIIAEFKPEIEDYLLKYFKPELLNRFNAQVVFKTLSHKDIFQIAVIQIKKLAKRLEDAQGIRLEVSDKAIDKIVSLGYSPFYGARNLQRVITEKLENGIANKFLRGEIKRGKVFTIEDIE